MRDLFGERLTGSPDLRPDLFTGQRLLLQLDRAFPRHREAGLGDFLAGQYPDEDPQVPVAAFRTQRAEQGDVLEEFVVLVVFEVF
jgi:hypothetical protein